MVLGREVTESNICFKQTFWLLGGGWTGEGRALEEMSHEIRNRETRLRGLAVNQVKGDGAWVRR